MNIQPISTVKFPRLQFSSNDERKTDVDRYATVRDLYEIENRIISNQEKLIKNQNEMIGKTLQSMSQLIYHINDGEYFDKSMDDASLLKLNVNV